MMITKVAIPTGIILSKELIDLNEWLFKNETLRPDNMRPRFSTKEESAEYSKEVAEYKEKLIIFNDGIESLVQLQTDTNTQTTKSVMDSHAKADSFRKEVEKIINVEVLRVVGSASEEMRKSEFFESYVQNCKQNLFRTYGF